MLDEVDDNVVMVCKIKVHSFYKYNIVSIIVK